MSESAPRIASTGTRPRRHELRPENRDPFCQIDIDDGLSEIGIEKGREPAARFAIIGGRQLRPFARRYRRELRFARSADLRHRCIPSLNRALLDGQVALYSRQASTLDHRADVVQHDARNQSRAKRPQEHRENPAARSPDQDRLFHAECRSRGENILRFCDRLVVPPVRIVVGEAAAAVVDHDDGTRFDRMPCEETAKWNEVARIP